MWCNQNCIYVPSSFTDNSNLVQYNGIPALSELKHVKQDASMGRKIRNWEKLSEGEWGDCDHCFGFRIFRTCKI